MVVPTLWARHFFCVDLLQYLNVQRSFRQQLLQPRVLILERLETFDVGSFHLPEMLASGIDRGFADLVLLRGLGDGHRICLPQHGDHLLFGELTLLHGLLALQEPFF